MTRILHARGLALTLLTFLATPKVARSAAPPPEDTTLQALIDAAPAWSTVALPRGDFYLGRPLEIPADKPLRLQGVARHDGGTFAIGTTRIRPHLNFFLPERAATNTALIKVGADHVELARLSLVGANGTSTAACGIRYAGGEGVVVRDAFFQSFNRAEAAAICGSVGKGAGFFHNLTSNVFRSFDLVGPDQEIRVAAGSLNGPAGSRLSGVVHMSDLDFEGGAGTVAPVVQLVRAPGQLAPSMLTFERNYIETAVSVCDLPRYPELVALDLDGLATVRDNQVHMKKYSGSGATAISCPDLLGVFIKARDPALPITTAANNIKGFDRSIQWDTTASPSLALSERLNVWSSPAVLSPQPDGSRSYPTGAGEGAFGTVGLRAGENLGLATRRRVFAPAEAEVILTLTEATVFELATTAAGQVVSLAQPPATANTTAARKTWRILNRIPGAFVVILNAADSAHPLALNAAHFGVAVTLAPGASRLFVVDQQGELAAVGLW